METKSVTLDTVAPGGNIIYMHKEIDDDSALESIKEIQTMDLKLTEMEESNTAKVNKLYGITELPPTDIQIMLNTPGGYCYQGFAIYDILSNISNRRRVKITVNGLCASMGIAVLLSVPLEYRSAYRNTTFMIHQVMGAAFGKAADMEECLDHVKEIHSRIWKIIADKTKITEKQLKECYDCKRDWYITAEEALELGLISTIY